MLTLGLQNSKVYTLVMSQALLEIFYTSTDVLKLRFFLASMDILNLPHKLFTMVKALLPQCHATAFKWLLCWALYTWFKKPYTINPSESSNRLLFNQSVHFWEMMMMTMMTMTTTVAKVHNDLNCDCNTGVCAFTSISPPPVSPVHVLLAFQLKFFNFQQR